MTVKIRALAVLGLTTAMMWASGCGHFNCTRSFGDSTCASGGGSTKTGGSGSTSSQTILVYFLNDQRAQFAGDAMDFGNTQTFSQIPNFVGPTIDQNQSQFARDGGIVILKKKFLYVPFSDGKLFGFTIDPTTAALTAIPGSPIDLNLPLVTPPSPIAADPTGAFIFVGDNAGIYVFSVNQVSGVLTPVTGSPFAATGLQPTSMTTDGLGKYLYVPDGTQITEFSYSSSTGALTSLGTVPSSVKLLVSESTGKYLFGSTQEFGSGGGPSDNNVYGFTISTTAVPGSITAMNAGGFPTNESVTWLAVTPDGKFLYTFNESTNNANSPLYEAIQGFTLANLPTQLTPLTGSPFTVFDSNYGKIDQSGKYMIVNGQESNAPVAGTFPIQIGTDGSLSSNFPATGSAGLFAITDEP